AADVEGDVADRREGAEPDARALDGDGGVHDKLLQAHPSRRVGCCRYGASGTNTSAAIPDLNTPSGSATRTLTANTWCRRSSTDWTLRGVNSLSLAMYSIFPWKRRPG